MEFFCVFANGQLMKLVQIGNENVLNCHLSRNCVSDILKRVDFKSVVKNCISSILKAGATIWEVLNLVICDYLLQTFSSKD